jgi:hypothetical protein
MTLHRSSLVRCGLSGCCSRPSLDAQVAVLNAATPSWQIEGLDFPAFGRRSAAGFLRQCREGA